MKIIRLFVFICLAVLCTQCKKKNTSEKIKTEESITDFQKQPKDIKTPKGMIWIPGGNYTQGARNGDRMALDHEKPAHPVRVDGFFMDKTEVTNKQFEKFVEATGYVTVAERPIEWEEIEKQVPPGTPKPHDSLLQPGSLVFKKTKTSVPNLYDFSQWWEWKVGANWKHPKDPGSSIEGKDDYPVVHIAYEDAIAYCKWARRRLPTEAEWELAANGNLRNSLYAWGNDIDQLTHEANTWNGEFPTENSKNDGYENKAPVKSFPPNSYGLYEMSGNVWEWTQDWYDINYYQQALDQGKIDNPKGAAQAYNPANPYAQEKIIKGGSFLCNASYCASYRISARMATATDSGQEHLGFRTVATPNMLSD
ncbi:formylglycine-generating enzyme family protein [Galbibacter sp. EGI 63066]|uniref:formylglycine-generating enzyme family protein n=1 Tax=Galbibacter sp. EGI 63066 TaxID=2993559 RepID=UPI00224910DA|nr:formylglycine-generating enzyme family protein [Galbibacter sp. EGI 63066]MCX2679123.1 formylglycine-generating enzyme family protein [Galbibacter sp. EGI 63066]